MFYSCAFRVALGAAGFPAFFRLCWAPLLNSCGGGPKEDRATTPNPTIKLAFSTDLGSSLTDRGGARDIEGKNVRTGGCAPVWPIFYKPNIQTDNFLYTSNFTTQTAAAGQLQTGYKARPPFYTASCSLPSVMKGGDFSTITCTTTNTGPYGDGTITNQQLTYKGKPLYYYVGDNQTRGQVEGHGLLSEEDVWFVAA